MVFLKLIEQKCKDAKYKGKDWDFNATDIVNMIDSKDVDKVYNQLNIAVKEWTKLQ